MIGEGSSKRTNTASVDLGSAGFLSIEMVWKHLRISVDDNCNGSPSRASRQRGSGRVMHGNDEDAALATSHTQSHLAEQFFVAVASQLSDTAAPPLSSHVRPLL